MDNLKIEAEKEAQIILNYFKAQDYKLLGNLEIF
jgi:hypothetical protein